MIPMVDLRAQYQALKAEIDRGIEEVLDSTRFILGPNVEAFEQEAAAWLGVGHAVSCASGTDALHLALRAAGIGPGDEVITSPFTFIATAEAIAYVGATPVFVDIDPESLNLDPQCVAAAVSERTRAILPVHLFGLPADMPALMALAERHGLIVVEDCAQSFGARAENGMTGAIGLAGCHSFFPSKNLGGYGDGGMVSTNDAELAEHMRVLRNHGSRERYHHSVIGYNSRLDELQAAILRVKLRHIEAFNQERRRVAASYRRQLEGVVGLPQCRGDEGHVFHQFTILSAHRDAIQRALAQRDIASAIYYPIPLHRQDVFAGGAPQPSLPVSERVAAECLSLPVYPELSEAAISEVATAVREAVAAAS